jgi:hypothetical protein
MVFRVTVALYWQRDTLSHILHLTHQPVHSLSAPDNALGTASIRLILEQVAEGGPYDVLARLKLPDE